MNKHILFLRVLVIANIVLLSGLGYWAFRMGTSEPVVEKHSKDYPLIDPSRSFIAQKDFLVNLQPLREKLAPIYKEFGEKNISLYIEFMNTGANISYNPDARMYPASLIKMPVAIAAAKKVETGEWRWDSELVLMERDIDDRFGDLAKEPIGTRLTIERLLKLLLVDSDNTAFNILLRNLGRGAIEQYLTDTGLMELFDANQNVTAREYTRIFRSLYTSSYLTRELSQKILSLLDSTEHTYLARPIGGKVPFPHKFGTNLELNVFADAGILYIKNRPVIMTVFYKGEAKDSAERIDEFFSRVATVTYEYFAKP